MENLDLDMALVGIYWCLEKGDVESAKEEILEIIRRNEEEVGWVN